MALDAGFYRYWGKACNDAEAGDRYHLLPYHCLDVAAVGWSLLAPDQPLCQRLARQLGVEPQWLQSWFCFCLMLHDLGKFARAFQSLVPDLSPLLVPYRGECVYAIRHDSLGFLLWKKQLVKRLSADCLTAPIPDPWLEIVCGHHGQPPSRSDKGLRSHFTDEDEQAAESYVRDLIHWWQPDLQPLATIDKQALRAASWQLAGIAVLADWLGSNQRIFNYHAEPMSLPHYWQEVALAQAPKALELAQWSQQRVAPYHSLGQQFPFIQELTPLQQYAESHPLAEGPQLFILEDVTGAGKTEAAMGLVHRLMTAGRARGLYVALPTMATANGMYARLTECYRALFAAERSPSLVLAHGAAQLSDDFVASFVETVALPEQADDRNYARTEPSASAYCNAWLADSRKKALLADVGVGTIDQALLCVLPARHQSLRLLGLGDKVLLVDEVHAYDPYMRCLLGALLEAHARQGGSAILLSATLPKTFRQVLLDGYATGLGREPAPIQQTDYPLVSHFSALGDLDEQQLATREEVRRHVDVRRLADEAQVLEQIRQAVTEGRSICWIRNTVRDARSAFEQLELQSWLNSDQLTLFHSRFAMVDRQRIEQGVLARFGKDSGPVQRQGQVLIATQVVEQSLDLDFDEMISDLAPVDLLIQRAGRLQRHIRDLQGHRLEEEGALDQRPAPCLYLLSPDPAEVEDKNWLKSLLPGTQAVYEDSGRLWLSANVLLGQEGFAMPEDARRLIEGVYGDEAQEQIPEPLQDATWQAQGSRRSQQGMGEFNRLKLCKGYTGKSGDWGEEVNIPTRLSAASATLALARVKDGALVPYAEVERHPWALSQLSVPQPEWITVEKRIPAQWAAAIERLKIEEPALRWCQVLPLVDELASLYHPEAGWDLNRRVEG